MRRYAHNICRNPLGTIWLVLVRAGQGAAAGFMAASLVVCAKTVHNGVPTSINMGDSLADALGNTQDRIIQDETNLYNNCKAILFVTGAGAGTGALAGLREAAVRGDDTGYQLQH